jgi:hypothetical protein
MGRLVVGLGLARSSARVLRHVPVLLVPGLLQAVALLAVVGLLLRSGIDLSAAGDSRLSGRDLTVLAGSLLATTAMGVWSGAVVVAIAADRFDGGDAGLRHGFATARRRLPALLAWSLVSATVGALLRVLEERLGPPGRWVTGGLGLLFSVGTVLVVPVLVLEGERVLPGLRRSARLFRERFGEAAGGQTGLTLALSVVFVAGVVLIGGPLLAVSTEVGLAALGVLLVAWLTAASVLQAILSAALHRVAVGLPSGGDFGDLTQVFPSRPQRRTPSYAGVHRTWDAS